jgi:Fe-S-cluster containining protein
LPVTQKEIESIKKYIIKNKIKIQKLTIYNQPTVDLMCPFRFNGKCNIYEVRPLICREFACNKSACETSNELLEKRKQIKAVNFKQIFGG